MSAVSDGTAGTAAASFEVVVTQLTLEADAVVSVRLERVDGAPLPAWEPGAHVDLMLPVGIARQYSLIESPADFSSYRVAVLQQLASRGGSEYVHVFLRPGQRVRVSAPRNHFALDPAPSYLLIGGGIGITPLLSMARDAAARGARWSLHYGGRSRRTMAFWRELVSEHGGAVQVWADDEERRLPLDRLLARREEGTLLYTCGPQPLIDAVRTVAAEHGWPEEDVRFERFAPTVREHGPDREIAVLAARSGVEVLVDTEESVLDGLLRAGIGISSSCRSGVCGACQVGVLEGEPEHRDDILTAAQQAANDTMLPCVSRACGERLVLDV